jgi:hypothetical protein
MLLGIVEFPRRRLGVEELLLLVLRHGGYGGRIGDGFQSFSRQHDEETTTDFFRRGLTTSEELTIGGWRKMQNAKCKIESAGNRCLALRFGFCILTFFSRARLSGSFQVRPGLGY